VPTTSASKLTADPAVERFRGDLAALGIFPSTGPSTRTPLALAVSGGPDSMAMLWLASRAFPGVVIAATVDHGLRDEAQDEAAMVAEWCAGHGIPHATLTLDSQPEGANVQAWARRHRYLALRDWARARSAAAIATAHHADDQAETFLMRVARGAGLAGLTAIRAINREQSPPVVRPLLGWRRAELAAIVNRAALPSVTDPSNADPRYDRTRFRDWLAAAPWFDTLALNQTVRNLAEAEADLAAVADWLWSERSRDADGALTVDIASLPRELRRRLTRRAIERVRTALAINTPAFSPASNIEALLDSLDMGRSATQAGVLATPAGHVWRFTKAPARRSH
jgi:tRNA(Ile)-lysidine synthase